MPYVTFNAEDPDGNPVEWLVLDAHAAGGRAVFQNEVFGPASATHSTRSLKLAAGTYSLWARSPGMTFAFPLTFTVAEDDGELAHEPLVVELSALSWVGMPGEAVGWARLTGRVPIVHGATIDRAVLGVSVNLGTNAITRVEYQILIEQVGTGGAEEVEDLHVRRGVQVPINPDGTFEFLAHPETLYRAAVPGYKGKRYFVSPAAGETLDLEAAIAAASQRSPYSFV